MLRAAWKKYSGRQVTRPATPPNGWVIFCAWGPCGYAPWAAGTFGTAGAIPLFYLLSALSWPLYVLTVVALIVLAIYAAGHAGAYWGVVDASPFVIDEVAGYLVTMALVPWSWQAAAAGFVLFRIFDIVKPWPASYFDGVKSGFGVIMDDVAAGVYAWIALALLRQQGLLP